MNNSVRPRAFSLNPGRAWAGFVGQRGRAFGYMIIGALLAFEIFNFSTTEFALRDVLGDLKFIGIPWATILSIAFCGIDFAGIARIFTPEQGADEPAEVWYLFGAWVLAAAMNATLTWWGVSVAIVGHTSMGASVVGAATIQKVVPIFVAVMVWVIRILIIGTFSIAGERMFSMAEARPRRYENTGSQPQFNQSRPVNNHTLNPRPVSYQANPTRSNNNTYHTAPANNANNNAGRPVITTANNLRPNPRPMPRPENSYQARPAVPAQVSRPEQVYTPPPEPTYHNLAD